MKILIASSASGGHLFPALSVARALRGRVGQENLFFLTEKNKVSNKILEQCGFEVSFLDFSLKNRLSLQARSSVIKLILTAARGFSLVKKGSFDVVVGFGGYVSVAPIIAAKLLGKRTLIHEQNVILGKANWFLSHFVDVIATSFPETHDSIRNSGIERKIVYTGLPLRQNLEKLSRQEAARFFGFDGRLTTILVLGGSIGSRAINQHFLQTIEGLAKKEQLQIIHICGFNDEAMVKSFYERHPLFKVRVFAFLDQMSYAYSCADLCICRSGASTIYELALFKVPALLIPYPHARAHQRANAAVLEKSKAGMIIEEQALAETLKEKLAYLLDNTMALDQMQSSFPQNLVFNARERLAQIIIAAHEIH